MRFFQQLTVFLKYRLYRYLPYPKIYSILYIIAPWALLFPKKTDTPLQAGLEKMGPIFIKLGQFLSARSDLLDPKVIQQLEQLCDRVSYAPESFFTHTLQSLQESHKIDINPDPLAAGSIAHVYSGTLIGGEKVAIKIQRPDLKALIKADLLLIRLLFGLLSLVAPSRIQLHKVFERFANTLSQEIDFQREAAHADALKTALKSYSRYCEIPKIYWQFSSKTTLVLQKVPGIRFQSLLSLPLDASYKKKIAAQLYNMFLHCVFQHGLFHADLHPGNIFFDFSEEKFWLIDFGIVARLSPETHKLVCRQVLSLLKKDYVSMAQAFVDGGWTPSDFTALQRQNFEWSLHMLLAPLMDLSLAQISLADLLKEILYLAKTYKIRVQPETVLLQKTLFVVEGLVRALDPDMNLIEAGSQEVLSAIANRYGLGAKISKILHSLENRL